MDSPQEAVEMCPNVRGRIWVRRLNPRSKYVKAPDNFRSTVEAGDLTIRCAPPQSSLRDTRPQEGSAAADACAPQVHSWTSGGAHERFLLPTDPSMAFSVLASQYQRKRTARDQQGGRKQIDELSLDPGRLRVLPCDTVTAVRSSPRSWRKNLSQTTCGSYLYRSRSSLGEQASPSVVHRSLDATRLRDESPRCCLARPL